MRLLVGLGNPGKRYAKTRHNIGFQIMDEVSQLFGIELRPKTLGGAEILWGDGTPGELSGEKLIVCEPQTYMNESGQAVRAVLDYYRLGVEALCVVHDDMDLAWGRLKVDYNAGSAGQKGVQSIIDHLGTKEFLRIRVGIGRPRETVMDPADYVLGVYTKEEEKELQTIKKQACQALTLLYQNGLEAARNQFH